MDQAQLNWLTNFIWNIADDVLRDVYVRGKYRDVILPVTVLRRLDAVLEPTKKAVLEMKAALDKEGVTTRHFYQPPKLRTLAEISADILALEQETEGLLSEITKGATA